MTTLVLASTSPYRAELLRRLGVSFHQAAPICDESRQQDESASALVGRLSVAKAKSLQAQFPDALIIGSDQVAERDGAILGKPADHAAAAAQLNAASGRTVEFLTGLCVLNGSTGDYTVDVINTPVRFRHLAPKQIERYLQTEQPYNCAGSFKSEGLGISLFRGIDGDDASALVGLPLIQLTTRLNEMGVEVP